MDTTKARRELGWRPRHDAADTMRETIAGAKGLRDHLSALVIRRRHVINFGYRFGRYAEIDDREAARTTQARRR